MVVRKTRVKLYLFLQFIAFFYLFITLKIRNSILYSDILQVSIFLVNNIRFIPILIEMLQNIIADFSLSTEGRYRIRLIKKRAESI